MKYKTSFQIIVIWILSLLTVGLYLMAFAPREEIASESENRMLAAFPEISADSVFSGEFTGGLETFLSDKLPARSSLAMASQSVMDMFSVLTSEDKLNSGHDAFVQGLLEEGGEAQVSDSDAGSDGTDVASEQQPDASPDGSFAGASAVNGKKLVPTPVEDYGYEGYVPDDSIMSRDTGIDYPVIDDSSAPDRLTIAMVRENGERVIQYDESKKQTAEAVEIYNRLAALVDGTVNVLIPPEAAYASDYLKKRDKFARWDSEIEKYMRSLAADNLNIYSVEDIIGREELAGEYLYFTSDHHWTPKGCYYAYREMMLKQGIIPVAWDDHSIVSKKFYGTYANSELPSGSMDTIEIIDPLTASELYVIQGKNKLVHREFITQNGNSYATAYVYGTVEPWGVIESRCNTGRKCMVLFDSFAKPLFPLLANHYDEQFICDLRHYTPSSGGGKLSEIIETYGIDDVYIVVMPIYVFGGYTLTNMNNYI